MWMVPKINANGSAADSKMAGEQPQQGKFESHLEDFYATLDQVGIPTSKSFFLCGGIHTEMG